MVGFAYGFDMITFKDIFTSTNKCYQEWKG